MLAQNFARQHADLTCVPGFRPQVLQRAKICRYSTGAEFREHDHELRIEFSQLELIWIILLNMHPLLSNQYCAGRQLGQPDLTIMRPIKAVATRKCTELTTGWPVFRYPFIIARTTATTAGSGDFVSSRPRSPSTRRQNSITNHYHFGGIQERRFWIIGCTSVRRWGRVSLLRVSESSLLSDAAALPNVGTSEHEKMLLTCASGT